MSTEKQLEHNSVLHIDSYLSIALSEILPHGENDSRHLSNFFQAYIF